MIIDKKYRWRNAIKSLLFIAGFGAYSGVFAKHILGGEINYTHLSAHTYKFTIKVYRDCNQCEFGTFDCPEIKNLEIYASPEELGYAKRLKQIPISQVSKRDITPLCNGVKSSCSGGSFPSGIEEYVFECTVDFDLVSTEYCQFEAAIRVESRIDAYVQNVFDGYYNFARINICNSQYNNSATMNAPVAYLLPENQSFTYNVLAKDIDGDSLSYHLVKAQKGWGQHVSFSAGFDENKPVSVYCPTDCNLNKTVWPIEGAGIEAESGWMGFTPVSSGQKGFMVIEVREWRKISGNWVLMGVTRRDNQVEVISTNNYAPKISTSEYDYFACAGADFQMDMTINDPVYGSTKDSVTLTYFSELENGKIQKVGSSKNIFDAFFTVPVNKGHLRNRPYYVTVIAQDNNCPITSTTYRTIAIKPTTLPKVTPVLKHLVCNKVSLNSGFNKPNFNQAWFVYQGNKLIETGTGNIAEVDVPTPGKYYVVYQLSDNITFCQVEIRDSINVPYFSLLEPNLKWPAKVCSNEEFELKAEIKGGTGPFKYWWNGGSGLKTKRFTLPKDSNIVLEMTDANGCTLKTNQKVAILPRLTLNITDTSLCVPTTPYQLQLKNRIRISGWKDSGVLSMNNQTTGAQLISPFNFTPTKSGSTFFGVFYTDKYQCHYNGQFAVIVVDPVPTGIEKPTDICSNNEKLNLNAATNCKISDGKWTCNPIPQAVSAGEFWPSRSGIGKFELFFQKDISGCLVRDTTEIVVKKAPLVSINEKGKSVFCATDSDISLTANINGGHWFNNVNRVPTNVFTPAAISQAGFKTAMFGYTYTDISNGCASTDSVVFVVNPSPVLDLVSDVSVCENEKLLLNPNPRNTANLQLYGDVNGLDIKKIDTRYLVQTAGVDGKIPHQLHWKITALEGCADQIVDFVLYVKPIPEFELLAQPDNGCVPFNAGINTITPNPNAVASKYHWVVGGKVNQSTAGNIVYRNEDVGLTNATVTGSLDGCVSEEKSVFIQGFESPIAAIEVSPKNRIVSADFSNLEFSDKSVSSIPYSVYWQFEQGSPATAIKPVVKVDFPRDTGLYQAILTVVTTEGCVAKDSTRIRVRPGLQFYVPTSFTPDSKGPTANEKFRIVMDSAASFNLIIRNKWGEIVYKSENSELGWDGTYLGEIAPAGVYLWQLEATTIYGNYVRKGGTFLLMR
ncbi:MAG: gliding motility-associated C-terminal domain-containing protein [Bacteroidia bacterium]|nr:gliding motility-associated C-terminal domain-containing protein [Bacteroidia bacterium]